MFFEDIIFNEIGNSSNVCSATEGFLLGNMFRDEYKGFKNYKVQKFVAKTEKEELILKLYELDFALNDLALYLDLHPEDYVIYNKFKDYVNEYNKIITTYEKIYGPLELTMNNGKEFEWLNKWPFEGVDI